MSPSDAPLRPRVIESMRLRVVRLPGGETSWRVGVAVVGLLIVAGGVVLLPLPGPGWVVIFLGLGLWATEFAWAARLLRSAKAFVRRWTDWVKARPRWVQLLLGALGLAFTAAVSITVWYLL